MTRYLEMIFIFASVFIMPLVILTLAMVGKSDPEIQVWKRKPRAKTYIEEVKK